jgi:hypothetical protein
MRCGKVWQLIQKICLQNIDDFDDRYTSEMDYITEKCSMDVYRFLMACCQLEKKGLTARNLRAFASNI